MFTGLVQQCGRLKEVTRSHGGWAIAIEYSPWQDPLVLGESIAVQGVCLTVTSDTGTIFTAELLDETMRRTAFSKLHSGARLNLERALAVGDRLGGHLVSGHVDECGRVLQIRPAGRDQVWRIECAQSVALQSVQKGSVALDGVSLTITAVTDEWVEVNLIPHTRANTSLCERTVGDPIHVEGDLIGKYVARILGKKSSITEDLLRENGFL